MKTTALIISFLVSKLSASGITLTRIPPCPNNLDSYSDSLDITTLLQEALHQQLQPYQINQPGNLYSSYSLPYKTQTAPHQITPNSEPQANQLYIKNILSDPTVQNILNSKAKFKEPIPVQYPVKTTNRVIGNVPQVVNNYFIVPPDYVNGKGNSNRRPLNNKSRSNTDGIKRGNRRTTDKDLTKNDNTSNESFKRKRRRQRRKKYKDSDDENSDYESDYSPRRNRLENEQIKEYIPTVANDSLHQYHNETAVKNGKNNKNTYNNTVGKTFIEEFRNKYPGLPEDDLKKLLSHLRRQIREQRRNQIKSDYSLSFDGTVRNDNKNTTKRHTIKDTQKYDAADDVSNHDQVRIKITDLSSKYTDDNKPKVSNPYDDTTLEELDIIAKKDSDSYFKDGKLEFLPKDTNNDRNLDDTNTKSGNRFQKISEPRISIRRQANRKKNTRKQKNGNSINRRPKQVGDTLYKRVTNNKHSPGRGDVSFRSPRVLERPNFRTKPVVNDKSKTNNNHKNAMRPLEKFITYSDIKQPHANKEMKYFTKEHSEDESSSKIETVYGHSKVVKYSTVTETIPDEEPPVVTYYIPENMEYENDPNAVVVTKRIPQEKFW